MYHDGILTNLGVPHQQILKKTGMLFGHLKTFPAIILSQSGFQPRVGMALSSDWMSVVKMTGVGYL